MVEHGYSIRKVIASKQAYDALANSLSLAMGQDSVLAEHARA
jgi:hypothetical protein